MKLLTTGEFAKFCGASKDTLIFYDRQGLLRPRYVSGNGYRRYAPEQFYDFDMISILKETGSSLTEIKNYLQKRTPAQILALLEEKKHILKLESERLSRRRIMLDEMSQVICEASQINYDVLCFEDLGDEKLKLVPTETDIYFDKDSDDNFLEQYNNYLTKLNHIPQSLIYGILIDRINLIAKRYISNCFFYRIPHSKSKKQLHMRVKGRYAVFSHKGNTKSHIESYQYMLTKIAEASLKIVGPMYIYDLMSYIMVSKAGEYAAKYCVQVE